MKAPHTAPPLHRFQRIVALLSPDTVVTGIHLATELEVSRKTIQRDLDYLRDQLNLPIQTIRGGRGDLSGYRLTKPIKICPVCARAHN